MSNYPILIVLIAKNRCIFDALKVSGKKTRSLSSALSSQYFYLLTVIKLHFYGYPDSTKRR